MERRMKTLMVSLGLAERVCSRDESQSRPKQATKDKIAAANAVSMVFLESAQKMDRTH
jgi:predicted AAA+ superfamily ATPase